MKNTRSNSKFNFAEFNFGAWLKTFRQSRRWSREAVTQKAQVAGYLISQQYIHFIESGKATNIGSDKIQALAAGLDLPLHILESALFQQQAPDIPIAGRTAAGTGVSTNEHEYQQATLAYEYPASELAAQGLYYIEIIGDSMAPKIEHGDLALIQPGSQAITSGRIYLVQERKSKKTTCKYLIADTQNPEQFWLVAEQEKLFPRTQLTNRYQLLGEVIEVRKTLTLSRPVL